MGGTGSDWDVPSQGVGAVIGVVVVFGFLLVHNAFIADIWFNIGPMLFAGAVIGFCLAWSYRKAVTRHSTATWFRYGGLHAAEMIVLGAVSLLLLRPRFTMAEMLVADDAFAQLLGPSLPLILGAMAVGTTVVWSYFGRRRGSLVPILITQVLVVFFLGHQFAFLGLVESSSALLVTAGGFAAITVGLASVFCGGVMGSTMALERLRRSP